MVSDNESLTAQLLQELELWGKSGALRHDLIVSPAMMNTLLVVLYGFVSSHLRLHTVLAKVIAGEQAEAAELLSDAFNQLQTVDRTLDNLVRELIKVNS